MSQLAIKADILNRLKNIKGHVAGIERMVEEDQPCANVLVQLSAVRASIEKIGIYILENNAIECLCDENKYTFEEKQKIEQVVKQMVSFLK